MDRELYFQIRLTEQMVGFWDLFAVKRGSSTTSAMNIAGVGPYLNVADDGTMRLHLEDEEVLDLTWQFVEYQQVDESGVYSCYFVNSADQTQYPATVTETSGELEIAITLPDNRTVIFQKNEKLKKFSTGTWLTFEAEQLYTIEMNSDRTFTSNLEGGISGTWHLKPLHAGSLGLDEYTVTFSFTLDGTPKALSSVVHLGPTGESAKVFSGITSSYAAIYWTDSKTGSQLVLRAPDQYPGKHTVIEADASKILGNWVTSEVTTFIYATFSSTTEETSDYTAVFNEDGTFELSTKNPVTGTWSYTCTSTQYGTTYYRYSLKITGQSPYYPISLMVMESEFVWEFYDYIGANTISYQFHRAE